jgi:hypothetical protein
MNKASSLKKEPLNLNNEVWDWVKGYENFYQVSNLGKVRSVDRYVKTNNNQTRFYKGQLLSQGLGKNGYYIVALTMNKVQTTKTVHRLVAETFVFNPNDLPMVNHIDENKMNNTYKNLEWCTQSYNNSYGTKIARSAIKKAKPVCQIDISTNRVIRTYPSIRAAEKAFGVKDANISAVCKGTRKTVLGYKWEYLSDRGVANV